MAVAIVVIGMLLLMAVGSEKPAPPEPVFASANGMLSITAVGLADQQADRASEDARQQVLEKAMALLLEDESLVRLYPMIHDHILTKHAAYIHEAEAGPASDPKHGLISVALRAEVDVRTLLKDAEGVLKGERYQRLAAPSSSEIPLAHRLRIRMLGIPPGIDGAILHEFRSLRRVLGSDMLATGGNPEYGVVVSGESNANPVELVAAAVLIPLQAKLGKPCFGVTRQQGAEVTLAFDAMCRSQDMMARILELPPAGLMSAPDLRKRQVISNESGPLKTILKL